MLAAMEYVIQTPICVESPLWVMAEMVYVQSYVLFAISEVWWRGGERDGAWNV